METVETPKPKRPVAALPISICGAALLTGAFVYWLITSHPSVPGVCAAALSLALFVFGCWRFVPNWMSFWKQEEEKPALSGEPKHIVLLIAVISVAVELVLFLGVSLTLIVHYGESSLLDGMWVWRHLDSQHYLDIMREWYVFGEEWGRTVQLVFLPGYPLTVYPLYRILNNDLYAGMLVSAIAFPTACCVFYRLLRLDLDHPTALRAVSFLWLLPGGFFFIAPMSESLYLLLCVSALYCMRRERWLLAGLFGAYAAFTRSMGLLLVVPLFFEWAHRLKARGVRQRVLSLLPVLIVPLGFACYLWINKTVSGNAFQFLTYQRDHWGQRLGWFFATAAYQTDLMIEKFGTDSELFFGLWLPNVLWHFGALTLFAIGSKRLRPSYAAWFIAYFAIAIGTTWLLSGPRYLLAMPVIALLLGQLCDRKRKYWLSAAILVPLSALYLIAFALRWQVW